MLSFSDVHELICFIVKQSSRAIKLRNLGQRPRNMLAKAGEGDRTIKTKMVRVSSSWAFILLMQRIIQPKHLFAGKRKGGKTQRR